MKCSWSLASRAVLFSVVVATLAWGVSGLVFWTTMTSKFGVVLWLIGGVAALLGVRIFSQRWVRHSLTQPLSEIEDMLRTLSVGERPHFRRYASAELNSIATAIERVTERIESVEQSVEHLQKVRSQFLANVSHELRTPLLRSKDIWKHCSMVRLTIRRLHAISWKRLMQTCSDFQHCLVI